MSGFGPVSPLMQCSVQLKEEFRKKRKESLYGWDESNLKKTVSHLISVRSIVQDLHLPFIFALEMGCHQLVKEIDHAIIIKVYLQ